MKKGRLLWVFGLSAVAALIVVAPSSATQATHKSNHGSKGTETVTFEGGRKNLHIVAPHTVSAGDNLKIENLTNPQRIGPHTFSLVTKNSLPTSKNAQKRCEHVKGGTICRAIARWHKVDFSTNPPTVNRNPVEVGAKGWDQKGNTKHRKGDSWFTDKEKQSFTQKVSAKPGTTLFFVCAIHPFLQGKIKVEPKG